ncbi:ATP-binding cassette domain-containing protein [Microbacterium foliorum]|uniref:ATP-binding cassette domain-containing protein n=1 Tax=Microbacterium foliorum TaxID=104336 RepID=UPI001D29DEB6|nr:ATP-binding cassette domain-containing protein [Microbacterium foliorum]CAH0201140.1 putative ABC transporter ATP-binding protein YxlF [Microbacterium foliorum]CAH0213665.1 putative ABC transporter ATP-binding protein YxlF [Microbacterium foliorum]
MPDGQVLEFTHVTKRFNDVTAVSDFSARVEPGVVTAFLGPNGAGKTTTLRILLGQVRATSGTATIGGVAFPDLRHPLRTIGSVLEETAYRPRRSAARQLTIAAKANGIPLSRVDEVLSLVGLEQEAEGRIGSFSLGMRQRLSVAHALLGDPGALVFDEPANGLDPEGIRWIRLLMRRLADEGRTVLVSSHVLSEVEQVADNVLVLSKGQLMLSSGIETLADPSAGSVVVDAADRAALTAALSAAGLEVEVLRSGLTVRGSDAGTVGAIAASAGIALSTLVQRGPTLEDVFIDLVRGGRFDPRTDAAPAAIEAPAAVEAPEAVETPVVETDAVETDADETDVAGAASAEESAPAEPEAPAEESSAEEEDAPAESAEDAASTGSEAPAESATAPSFDEILFGTTPATNADDEAEDDDPRSAAVSSMLAQAARAYYEDEPKEYPLENASSEDSVVESIDETASEGAAVEDAADDPENAQNHEHAENHENAQNHEHAEHHDSEHQNDADQNNADRDDESEQNDSEHHRF